MRRLLVAMTGLLLLLTAACGQEAPGADGGGVPTGGTTAPEPADPQPTEPAPTEPQATTTTDDGGTDDGDDGGTDDGDDGGGDGTDDEGPDPDAGADEVLVYYARSGAERIWIEPLEVSLDEPTVAVARAAMEALVDGPPSGSDPGLVTMAPAGTTVRDVAVKDGGVLVVDLSGDVLDGSQAGSSGEGAFAQQLAYTGTQFSSVERVLLWVEGEPVDELWGHLDWSQPVEPEEFVLSPVTFDSHAWNAEVPAGSVTVGGKATTFEATVVLRLYGPGGTLVEEAFTTATEGGPGRGDWEHTFDLDQPGTWKIEAAESDPSDGEGRPPYVATLELRAR